MHCPLIQKNENLLKSQKLTMFIDRVIAGSDLICEVLLALFRGPTELLSPHAFSRCLRPPVTC